MTIVICEPCKKPMNVETNGIAINSSLNRSDENGEFIDKQVGDRYKCTNCNNTIITSFGTVKYDPDNMIPVDVRVSGGTWGEDETDQYPVIEKLTWQPLFDEVKSGQKTFDVRLGNMKVKEGDVIRFIEYNPETDERGAWFDRKVVKVLRTKKFEFWSKEDMDKHGFVVMGLKP